MYFYLLFKYFKHELHVLNYSFVYLFSRSSKLKRVLGAQKNHLIETILVSTHNMF